MASCGTPAPARFFCTAVIVFAFWVCASFGFFDRLSVASVTHAWSGAAFTTALPEATTTGSAGAAGVCARAAAGAAVAATHTRRRVHCPKLRMALPALLTDQTHLTFPKHRAVRNTRL